MYLIRDYKTICNLILNDFCKKHDYQYDGDDAWVSGAHGTIALVNDLFIDMADIVYDLEKNVPKDKFIQWYDYRVDSFSTTGAVAMNYGTWLKSK